MRATGESPRYGRVRLGPRWTRRAKCRPISWSPIRPTTGCGERGDRGDLSYGSRPVPWAPPSRLNHAIGLRILAFVSGNKITTPAAAITNIGLFPERTSVELAEEALDAALAEAGCQRQDIDGLVWIGTPLGASYDQVCVALGLRPGFVVQTWTHGRFTGTCLQVAAMAVATRAATTATVCLGGIKGAPYRGPSDRRKPWAGLDTFVRPAAIALSRASSARRATRPAGRRGAVVPALRSPQPPGLPAQ